jgi:hypothetical protein
MIDEGMKFERVELKMRGKEGGTRWKGGRGWSVFLFFYLKKERRLGDIKS